MVNIATGSEMISFVRQYFALIFIVTWIHILPWSEKAQGQDLQIATPTQAELNARASWSPQPRAEQPPKPLRDPEPPKPASVIQSSDQTFSGHAMLEGGNASSLQVPEAQTEAQNVGILSDIFGGAIGPGAPTPSHRVIRSPFAKPSVDKLGSRHSEKHPPHNSFSQRKIGAPALIPQAKENITWKTPYSYGYFGASNHRNWSRQYGYRDRYTQWSLR